ncbi:hypothetical protein AJ87_35820 [Rhizobium yanglingense]|nr:hypothetical protein AJ87_35820 [Rhizobium yanglingense]
MAVKIATFNVNGINGRLDVLLRWLKEASPDIACLQELKTPDEKFRDARLRRRDMGPSGMARKAGTVSPSWRKERSL